MSELQFQTHQFQGDEVSYITPSWEDMNQLTFEISRQMRESGGEFDRIVTLAKGGWPMTRSLVDFLQVKKVASIGVKFYCGVNQTLDQPDIYQDIPVSLRGERVVLFDDVADSGRSLLFVKDYLEKRGVKQVTTATLFYKPHSQYKPDHYGAETEAWIIFPYEPVEMSQLLLKKWEEAGSQRKEIQARFEQMGLPLDLINYYWQQ